MHLFMCSSDLHHWSTTSRTTRPMSLCAQPKTTIVKSRFVCQFLNTGDAKSTSNLHPHNSYEMEKKICNNVFKKILSITVDKASNNMMVDQLHRLLKDFPGPANQARCFLHI